MVTRRRALKFAAGALTGTAGCLDRSDSSGRTPTPVGTPIRRKTAAGDTPARSTPPGGTDSPAAEGGDEAASDLDEWEPSWTLSIPEERVLGLDRGDGVLYATLSTEDGPSAVAAVDPAASEVRWRTEFEGEATSGSAASYRPIARGGWGVTLADGALYAVTGQADAYEWTAIRAVDPGSGQKRWSFRKARRLAVHGTVDGIVYATGLEFFEPESSHDVPEDPLVSVVYAIDADRGTPRWTREFRGVADVAVGPGGVSIATLDRLVGLAHDGSRRFEVSGGAPGRAVRAVDGRIYYLVEAQDDSSLVRGISPAGDEDWAKTLPVHEVLLDGDRLYAGGDVVLALEPDGTIAWRDGSIGQWLLLSPDDRTLYTRAAVAQDRVGAYRAGHGEKHWTYVPPDLTSRNAWPLAATRGTAVAEGITTSHSGGPFTSIYPVDEETGEATKSTGFDPLFDAVGMDGTVYVGGASIHALDP